MKNLKILLAGVLAFHAIHASAKCVVTVQACTADKSAAISNILFKNIQDPNACLILARSYYNLCPNKNAAVGAQFYVADTFIISAWMSVGKLDLQRSQIFG
jgi:hypothetical protein